MRNDPREIEIFGKQLSDPRYLGNIETVSSLVSDFCAGMYEQIKTKASGQISNEIFTARLRAEAKRMADIFEGRDSSYRSVIGWNTRFALGLSIKQYLGPYWERIRDDVDDDPAVAFFVWLAAHLAESVKKAFADGGADPDLPGMEMRGRMERVVKVLLGTNARR